MPPDPTLDEASPIDSAALACRCSATEAWEKANFLTCRALDGDPISLRIFAWHIDHAIRLSSR